MFLMVRIVAFRLMEGLMGGRKSSGKSFRNLTVGHKRAPTLSDHVTQKKKAKSNSQANHLGSSILDSDRHMGTKHQ